MERRPFGATGREVAVVGQGTWNIDAAHRRDAVAALRRGLVLGMSHIDTAEMYGDAEPIVGEAISGRRDEVFLVSKVLPDHASRRGVVDACTASLRRLGTDHLDCYLLHWPGHHALEETFAGFDQLQSNGEIRSWGVSNFDEHELEQALGVAGEGRIACNQVLYYLKERAIEHAVLPWCERHGVAVVAYSPFGQGDFPPPSSRGGRVLAEIARLHGATSRQVALRFLLRHRAVFTIPKAAAIAHTEDNARAGDLELSPDELARIDESFPLGRKPRALPSL